MIRNTALLTLLVFTVTLFTPLLMQPKEAEAHDVGELILGAVVTVVVSGAAREIGKRLLKILQHDHSSSNNDPSEHTNTSDTGKIRCTSCGAEITESSYHVTICTGDNCNVTVYTCGKTKCDKCSNAGNSYDQSWW